MSARVCVDMRRICVNSMAHFVYAFRVQIKLGLVLDAPGLNSDYVWIVFGLCSAPLDELFGVGRVC